MGPILLAILAAYMNYRRRHWSSGVAPLLLHNQERLTVLLVPK